MLFRQPQSHPLPLHPHNSINDSVLSTARHPIDTRPFLHPSRVQKPKPFISTTSNLNPSSILRKNELISAVTCNPLTLKLELNPQFIEFLVKQYAMEKVVVISIWGAPKSGKSFLVDSLFTLDIGQPYRIFSKSENKGANCSTRRAYTKENNPIQFIDWSSAIEIEEELKNNLFLLMYLTSSAILLNYSSNDPYAQTLFIEFCEKIKQKITSNQIEYSLPQLISIRRDVTPSNNRSTNFIELTNKLELFQPSSNMVFLNYPGSQNVQPHQITDVPVATLDKHFVKATHSLLDMLKRLKPMYINDNPVTASILSVLMQSYVNMINRFSRVVIDNCWENVLEALAVNGFNNFVTIYTEYLQNEFKNQKSVSRYELFRKLTKIKNQSNYKLQNFINIKGDPIIDKYKDKLRQFIKGKQQIIQSINKSKSNTANSKHVSDLKRMLNSQNLKEEIVFKYVDLLKNMPQDYNRCEIILGCVKELIGNEIKRLEKKIEAPEMKSTFQNLKETDRQIDRKNQEQNVKIGNLQKKIKETNVVNSRYQLKIDQKQRVLTQTIRQNAQRDKERRDAMTANQKQAEAQLFKLEKQQNIQLDKQHKIISGMKSQINSISQRLKKEEADRAQVKSRIQLKNQQLNELDKKIKTKERVLKDRQLEVQRLKDLLSKPEKKTKTCGCFG